MRRVGQIPDSRRLTAVDYAKISNDEKLLDLLGKIMGD